VEELMKVDYNIKTAEHAQGFVAFCYRFRTYELAEICAHRYGTLLEMLAFMSNIRFFCILMCPIER
jgi:hypothetical protein